MAIYKITEMIKPFRGSSHTSKLKVTLSVYKMGVKANVSIRNVRQINCDEIPDIRHKAVRGVRPKHRLSS